ncbi:unnamed protein product [Echinostoma caproni]|uniref:G_PROTEIN_RECEP_F1_2 domain-containing protein n=1 Tax=Echinostoma caproni TaxID=27848 RepID=A0A183ABF6_9TREM|nr:unnamed protein product [Echinostoma caproni]
METVLSISRASDWCCMPIFSFFLFFSTILSFCSNTFQSTGITSAEGGSSRDRTLCLVWYSMDIFFTATTIIHLCTISLDRYLALRRPFRRNRGIPRICHSLVVRIVMCWFVPFSIAGPLFIFALQQEQQGLDIVEPLPVTETYYEPVPSANRTQLIESDNSDVTKSYKGCGPNDPSFVLTAIGVTFVLPLIIMTTTYVLTVRTLQQHMEQVKAIRLYKPTHTRAARSTTPYLKRAHSERVSFPGRKSSILMQNVSTRSGNSGAISRQPSDIVQHKPSVSRQSPDWPTEHPSDKSDMPCSNNGKVTPTETENRMVLEVDNQQTESIKARILNKTYDNEGAAITSNETDMQSAEMKLTVYQGYKRVLSTDGTNSGLSHFPTFARIHSGKRAVRVIGVLFGLFVTCYLPFFIVYIIDVMCVECKSWTTIVIPHLEWLGYLSSMLNPVVYHSFNPTFRRTFRRIFRCACRSLPDHHAIWCRRVRI